MRLIVDAQGKKTARVFIFWGGALPREKGAQIRRERLQGWRKWKRGLSGDKEKCKRNAEEHRVGDYAEIEKVKGEARVPLQWKDTSFS